MGTLSGGERQKVFIAAALAQGARILLLDEPTTFLDPRHQSEVLRILRTVNRGQGVTVLAVTHDLNAAALVSDRVVALKAGRVAFDGLPADLMRNEVLRAIYDQDFLFVPHPENGRPMVLPEVVR
jgi:iron complex transport system ATP-binding protein